MPSFLLLHYTTCWFCSVQFCLFVQCWPGIFLVQCRGNLCNVGAAFAATGYYWKINRSKIKIAEKWCSDDIALGFFLCSVVWSLLDNIVQGFYLCNVVPRVLRQHWAGFFPVRCCLEPLGQHCTRFLQLLVQCCPKRIKTTLDRFFSCAMLSGPSRPTLHRLFTRAMLFQKY